MLNFASSSSANASAQSAAQKRVTAWVQGDERYQRILAAESSIQLMVSEVACFDEGCVPLETIVIVVGAQARWMGKLLRPLSEVTAEQVTSELELPARWWLYSRLQALRTREGSSSAGSGAGGCTQSEVEAAYRWLERHCGPGPGAGGLLGVLAAAASAPSSSSSSSLSSSSSSSTAASATASGPSAAAAALQNAATAESGQDGQSSSSSSSGGGMTASRALFLLSLAVEGLDVGRGEEESEREGGSAPAIDADNRASVGQVQTAEPTAVGRAPGDSGLRHIPAPSASAPTYFTKAYTAPPASALSSSGPPPRHDKAKGVRQRGCPCCDPDSIDGYVDKMFMSNI